MTTPSEKNPNITKKIITKKMTKENILMTN